MNVEPGIPLEHTIFIHKMKTKKIPRKARAALAEGNIAEANAILGDLYSIQGIVVEGRKLGRTIGFPTANLKLNEHSPLFLANGVYAVKIKHQKALYKGMANIGIRPTFEQHVLTLEVNLFDFSGDLYGQKLTIYFVEKIRDEKKFPGVDELRQQITLDKNRITELLG
jgi:riboflavin kinase / FMN adenylyltransferase